MKKKEETIKFSRRYIVLALLLLSLGMSSPRVLAQADPKMTYQAKRQEAAALFDRGRRLEALPLLEELVKINPRDDEMLVALAASLVDRAATLDDQDAAGRDRFRARDLLERAGSTSPLAQNLLQLLRQLPANGTIKFANDPAAEQLMRAGEAAFSRRDFEAALSAYSRALELEPRNYSTVLFIANTYDRKNDRVKAREWYERAIKLDANVETAYRYYADMVAKEGDMAKARSLLIQAAVAEPYNRTVWRELQAWAALNDTQINLVYVGVPRLPKDGEPLSVGSDPKQPHNVGAAWQAYRWIRAKWQQGDDFKKHFPHEAAYRHTLAEESEALTGAAQILARLKKEDSDLAAFVAADHSLSLLLNLHRDGLLEPYVLFSLGDSGIAQDYTVYRAKNRAKLEEYMDKFVVPPASTKQ